MSIELISKIKPKNNGDFAIVDAIDVQIDDTGKRLTDALEDLTVKAETIVGVYVQDEEPVDALEGAIWVDTDEDGLSSVSGKKSSNVYVVDAATTDITTVDFSKYAIGDVVLVTSS